MLVTGAVLACASARRSHCRVISAFHGGEAIVKKVSSILTAWNAVFGHDFFDATTASASARSGKRQRFIIIQLDQPLANGKK
jgi:hypothetical protein